MTCDKTDRYWPYHMGDTRWETFSLPLFSTEISTEHSAALIHIFLYGSTPNQMTLSNMRAENGSIFACQAQF